LIITYPSNFYIENMDANIAPELQFKIDPLLSKKMEKWSPILMCMLLDNFMKTKGKVREFKDLPFKVQEPTIKYREKYLDGHNRHSYF
jgi:hypothetical protein